MLKFVFPMSVFLLATPTLVAGPCAPDTLANYIALGVTGCTVGPLIVNGFSFSVLSSGGTPLIVNATQINVTPQTGAEYGLSFTSTGLHVAGNDFVNYSIGYTEDPEGPIRSLDDVLDDPVTSPGRGEVSTLGCLDAAFVGTTCSTSTVSIDVFDAGTSSHLADSVSFTGVTILGVLSTVSLNGNTTGSASINGVKTESFVAPEPGTWLPAALTLAALIFVRKSRLKRLQIGFERRA